MKIVVMSDSHGCNEEIDYVLKQEKKADAFLHCGDICVDTDVYPQIVTVCGNNDFYDYPIQRIINVGKHRILMMHSHTLSYMNREQQMVARAKKKNCDIVCYGHTHVAFYEEVEGVHIINPGSLYCSRDGRPISYVVIDVKGTSITVDTKYIEK